MSKVITSPIPRWAGTVTIADPLSLPQAQEIEMFLSIEKAANSKTQDANLDDLKKALNTHAKVPAIEACVEKWELENFVAKPFPASPKDDAHKLINWLFEEIKKVYIGESYIPNES